MARREEGNLQIIFGPMFCGKSTELIRRIRRYTIARERCLVMKYAKDTRYESADAVATHDRMTWKALPCSQLFDFEDVALEHDVIGIDEGQFFADVVEFAEKMANAGKTVIVAALDGDFRRRGFGRVLELVPLAEEVTKLKAVCMQCQGDASFSMRTVADTRLELIGGSDMYEAVCRTCYNGTAKPMPTRREVAVEYVNVSAVTVDASISGH